MPLVPARTSPDVPSHLGGASRRPPGAREPSPIPTWDSEEDGTDYGDDDDDDDDDSGQGGQGGQGGGPAKVDVDVHGNLLRQSTILFAASVSDLPGALGGAGTAADEAGKEAATLYVSIDEIRRLKNLAGAPAPAGAGKRLPASPPPLPPRGQQKPRARTVSRLSPVKQGGAGGQGDSDGHRLPITITMPTSTLLSPGGTARENNVIVRTSLI